MLAFLGTRPISRAQEARVLETSRQMLESPDAYGWLVPQLNGEPRLRKPPLCYWYTAASFKLFGVNEFAGRLPTLVLGWLTVGATFLLGRDVGRCAQWAARRANFPLHAVEDRGDANDRLGFLAAATLGSSYFFIRFVRSAETDTPAMLGTVLACWAILRGLRGSIAWFLLAAAGIALGAMTKGMPAVYPVVFVALLAILSRSWRPLTRFAISGAPVLALALIVPWFVYVLRDPAGAQIEEEMKVVAAGRNHFGLFYEYIPKLLLALLPWSGLFVAAVIVAIGRWRQDAALRVIAMAVLCVFGPLALALNNQPHYLLPVLPACAVLVAWVLDRLLIGDHFDAPATLALRLVFGGTAIAVLMAAPGLLIGAYVTRKTLGPLDWTAALGLMIASVVLFTVFRRREAQAQLLAWASLMLLVMPIVAGWWAPRLNRTDSRAIAADVRTYFGDGPYINYGTDANIAMGFNLRQTIRNVRDEAALRAFLATNPTGVAIVERDRDAPEVPPLPGVLARELEIRTANEILAFYRVTPGR